jgi:putative redox protein
VWLDDSDHWKERKMVVCKGGEKPFRSIVSNGRNEIVCDIPLDRGGQDAGFSPTDFLEASLACCINVTLRMYAQTREMKLSDVVATVTLNKDDPEQVFVKEEIELIGDLTAKERKTLLQVASQCTITKTVLKKFVFDIKESYSESAIKA